MLAENREGEVEATSKEKGASKKAAGSKAPLNSRDQNMSPASAKKKKGRSVEEVYQKKTPIEHVLIRPDTYVGSVERTTQDMWVYDSELEKVVKRQITYVPALYKIFDEIIVNAADNKQRDNSMNQLKVTIDSDAGSICVRNNGKGIPVEVHKEEQVYVPELIFGHLLTGSNFDDTEKKTTGGRNGYGAKLTNIFSTKFIVETADSSKGKKYRQVFKKNMSEKEEPVIVDYDGKDFTSITFYPDWKRFSMDGLEADTEALLQKRVHDIAGVMSSYGGKGVKVSLNGKTLDISSFKEYMEMYEGMEPFVAHESTNGWDILIGPTEGQAQQVSYVNAICTIRGGQHVNHIVDQVVAHLTKGIKKKEKGVDVKPHHIKNHLNVCVNALVENPAFDSQSKETLNTKPAAFGGRGPIILSDKTLKAIEKSAVVEAILSYTRFQAQKGLTKKSGKKTSKLTGITKLDDANFAGTAKSDHCTLILTEGDSAKALAVSGLGVVGRDYFGVFPLKGKLLNVRDSQPKQVSKNEEISNVVKILGLKFGTAYTDTKSLRYGHLMIMTDQDHDGSHIKGLLINLIHKYWPSLLKIDGFLQEFITPIVKCTKGHNEKVFYTIPEYEKWRENIEGTTGGKGWSIKYYKGLGTSTAKEAKEYFADIDTHKIPFEWEDDDRDDNLIDLAFSKKRSNERKDWLQQYEPGTFVDYNVVSMNYDSFINRELILYSREDNIRSIPCMLDGFKPSQRKVLFACFKRKLKNEIKVAQLAGYVSEHAAYHHGEVSLHNTIVGMAQNFCGNNNINLLYPSGQFGTRLMGGKDSASARYIFTRLERIARTIFHPDDDATLTYLEDDGLMIEPEYYMPVLPMILVNGVEGIGTGYSTSVPQYSPRDIVENLRRRLRGDKMVELQPWYRGFRGDIKENEKKAGSYIVEGIIERTGDETVEITELPVKKWTQDYKATLEKLLPGAEETKGKGAKGKAAPAKGKGKGKKAAADDEDENEENADEEEGGKKKGAAAKPKYKIKDFKENHSDTTVHFTVTMAAEDLDALESTPGGLAKFFKIESSTGETNMTMFDADGKLRKYTDPLSIMEDFYNLRLEYYGKRKAYLLEKSEKEWRRLDNKARFVRAIVGGKLDFRNQAKAKLLAQLQKDGYELFMPDSKITAASAKASEQFGDDNNTSSDDEDTTMTGDSANLAKGYEYLLGMKLWTLTKEHAAKIEAELVNKTKELDELKKTTIQQMWERDLDAVCVALDECDQAMIDEAKADASQRLGHGRGGKSKKGKGKRGAEDDSGDSDFGGGGSRKNKKKKAGGPPTQAMGPAPAAHSRSTETVMDDGSKVSIAFAEALAAGRFQGERPRVIRETKTAGGRGRKKSTDTNADGEEPEAVDDSEEEEEDSLKARIDKKKAARDFDESEESDGENSEGDPDSDVDILDQPAAKPAARRKSAPPKRSAALKPVVYAADSGEEDAASGDEFGGDVESSDEDEGSSYRPTPVETVKAEPAKPKKSTLSTTSTTVTTVAAKSKKTNVASDVDSDVEMQEKVVAKMEEKTYDSDVMFVDEEEEKPAPKPKAAPKAEKPKAAAKAKAPAKAPPVAYEVQSSDDEKPAPKPKAKAAAAKPKKTSYSDGESESEDVSEDGDGSGSDYDDVFAKPKAKKEKAPAKPAATKAPAKPKAAKAPVVKAAKAPAPAKSTAAAGKAKGGKAKATDDMEEDDPFAPADSSSADERPKPAAKAAGGKRKLVSKPKVLKNSAGSDGDEASPKKKTKVAAAKPKAVPKPAAKATKKKPVEESEGENEDSGSEVEMVSRPAAGGARPRRAAPVSYVNLDDDESDEE